MNHTDEQNCVTVSTWSISIIYGLKMRANSPSKAHAGESEQLHLCTDRTSESQGESSSSSSPNPNADIISVKCSHTHINENINR